MCYGGLVGRGGVMLGWSGGCALIIPNFSVACSELRRIKHVLLCVVGICSCGVRDLYMCTFLLPPQISPTGQFTFE